MVSASDRPSPRTSTPRPYNATAWQQLADAAGSGQQIEAVLLKYEPEGQAEAIAWGFLINPSSLEFENAANYGEVSPHATTVTSSQYSHTTGQVFTTPGMMFDTWCCRKSLRSLLDGLKKLLEADPENDQYAPPLLRFSWGSFNLGPLLLMKYSYKITAVLDGEPAAVRDLTLTFKEQPRPLTQAEQEAAAQARLAAQAADRELDGKPRLPLTDRQQAEAKQRAELFLQRNIALFSADVQAVIRAGGYKLEANPDTGQVTLLNPGGTKLGIVSQFDGTNHRAGQNISTLPLAQNASLGSGNIGTDGAIATTTAS